MPDDKSSGSGFDALLSALKQSGVNMDGRFDDDKQASSGAGSSGGGGGSEPPHVDVEMNFLDRISTWGKGPIIAAIIGIIIIGAAAYWWFHPAINVHNGYIWIFGAIFILFPAFVLLASRARAYRFGSEKVEVNESKGRMYMWLTAIPVAVVVVALIGLLVSQPFWPGNAEKFSSILETTTDDFAEDIQEVNYSEVPIIDRASAELLGSREMGSIPEYVSQFEINDTYGQINYKGVPVRVSVLGYADIFKWWANRDDGIPAYAMVDMTTQNAEIVRLGDNPIYYSPSEPLERNIERYVQLKYPFYMFEEFSFEIDEDGHPWWICPVQNRTIGLFDGETIERVVLCDANTGECQDLELSDVPEWVDRAYPAELLIQQYNWYGAYHNGWINSWLGQSGVVKTTPARDDSDDDDSSQSYSYIAKDDDVWVYTGVTSATSDSSIIGFVLVNQRTQESHFYSVSGATEPSAMESAEGQVQNLRYESTFPILINVADQPTYFMALKDAAGLVKKFAMIDIQRYQNVAVGDTVEETQTEYEALLATNGVLSAEEAAKSKSVETTKGVIDALTEAVIDGNSHFYVTLSGKDDTIYDFALPGLIAITHYSPGDTIDFNYLEGDPTATVQSINGEKTGNMLTAEEAEQEQEVDETGENADAEATDEAATS